MPGHPDFWALAKQIDGYPYAECSFPVFSARVGVLEGYTPRVYYEYASSFDEVVRMLQLNSMFGTGTAPTRYGFTIGLGAEWFESGFHAPEGRLTLPQGRDAFRGRHHVVANGFDLEHDELRVLNPWPEWGVQGQGFMSRSYFDAHVDEIFVSRTSEFGPSPALADLLATDPKNLYRAWLTNNPEDLEQVDIRGRRLILASSTTMTFDFDFVSILELRTVYRPVARCHVHHRIGRPSAITELFVMPRFRRRGYGRFLEGRAAETAREAESSSLEAFAYEADARPRVLPLALGFLRALDYTAQTVAQHRPNVRVIASRPI